MDLTSTLPTILSRALVATLVAWWLLSAFFALAGNGLYMARTSAVNSAHKAARKVYEQVDKTSPLWLVIPVLVLIGGMCLVMFVVGVWKIHEAAVGFAFTAVAGGAALAWALGSRRYREALRAEVDGKIGRLRSVYLDTPLRVLFFGFHLVPWTAFAIFLLSVILDEPFSASSAVQILIILALSCYAVFLGVISGLDMGSGLIRADVSARGDGAIRLGLFALGFPFWSRTWPTSSISGVEIAAYIYDPGFRTWEINALVARSELRLTLRGGAVISLGFLEMPDDFTPARWIHPKILRLTSSLSATLAVQPQARYLSARLFPWPRFQPLQDPTGQRPDLGTLEDRRAEVIALISELKGDKKLSKEKRDALRELERELQDLTAALDPRPPGS